MKIDNSLIMVGGLLVGLSFGTWMVMSPSDVKLDDSTAVKTQAVENAHIEEAAAAVSDSAVKKASVDFAEFALTGFSDRSSDFSEGRSSEIASDEALPIVHLGDPMLSVDATDQDFEERHIGDRSLDPLSPE